MAIGATAQKVPRLARVGAMSGFWLGSSLVLAGLASAAGAAEEPAAAASAKGTSVTLTGCVADADSNDFVLTHVQRVSPPGPQVMVLGARGMELAPGEPIYWLSKDSIKRIRPFAGQKVEVSGTITDVSTGQLQIKYEPGKADKVEIDARGKDASARTGQSTPGKKGETKTSVPIHRIAVETVKMVAETCP
jgi:hypothetical protein